MIKSSNNVYRAGRFEYCMMFILFVITVFAEVGFVTGLIEAASRETRIFLSVLIGLFLIFQIFMIVNEVHTLTLNGDILELKSIAGVKYVSISDIRYFENVRGDETKCGYKICTEKMEYMVRISLNDIDRFISDLKNMNNKIEFL